MKFFFIIFALLLAGCATEQTPSDIISNVGCTKELMQCPDGSTVARVAPDCSFALCPEETTNSSLETTTTYPRLDVNESIVPPVVDFAARATKKKFGTYVTPTNSPVTPEKFSGYHTGIDSEFEDVTDNVEVMAVADGTVVYSGMVSGYGGVVGIGHRINNVEYVAIYGHLDPTTLIRSGTHVSPGMQVGILGDGYTHETDGERKHLHFALHKGTTINLRGYVSKQTDLSGWVDPNSIIK